MFRLIFSFIIINSWSTCIASSKERRTISRSDFENLCEEVGSLVASGVKPNEVTKIVIDQIINKYDEPTDTNSAAEADELNGAPMIVQSSGFWNFIVQIMLKLFYVDNMVVNVSYAENLNMLVLGKRSTEGSETPHSAVAANRTDICKQIDFPYKLNLNNQREATLALNKISTEAKNLIQRLFSDTFGKPSSS